MDIFCIFVTLCGGKVTFVQLDSYLSCYANLAMMMILDHLHDIHRPGDQYCCSPQHISVTVTAAPVQCNVVMQCCNVQSNIMLCSTCTLQRIIVVNISEHVLTILQHCCYQGAFQEVNILINRAHLVNVKLVLTELLYGKSYFSITIKVISNLTNKHGIILSGQTFVQK